MSRFVRLSDNEDWVNIDQIRNVEKLVADEDGDFGARLNWSCGGYIYLSALEYDQLVTLLSLR